MTGGGATVYEKGKGKSTVRNKEKSKEWKKKKGMQAG